MRITELGAALDDLFPPGWAEPWDNVGLTIGRADAEIKRVMVALDATLETVAEAVDRHCELLLTHHPFPWHEHRRYDLAAPEGRLLAEVLRAGLNLFAVHTNLDASPQGHAALLAHRLGMTDLRPIKPGGDRLVKIVVFVPREDAARVRAAMDEAGAGKIGNYRGCSFTTAGIGRFIPEEGARPARGGVGLETIVDEERVEAICQGRFIERILQTVRAVHPYETMAYDVFPEEFGEAEVGLGRVGRIVPTAAREFLCRLKESLGVEKFDLAGPLPEPLERVAVCPGAAGDMIGRAAAAGAQILIGGEFSYHDVLTARAHSLALVAAGHYETELPAVEILWARCCEIAGEKIEIIRAESERNPFAQFREGGEG